MKKRNLKYYKFFILFSFLFSAVLLFFLVKILWYDNPITFEVILNTEKVEVYVNKDLDSKWHIPEGLIRNDLNDSLENFSGAIQIPKGAEVIVERIAYGPLSIIIEVNDPNKKIKTYDEYFEPLSEFDNLTVFILDLENKTHNGESVVWSLHGLEGQINTGRPVAFENESSIPLLRSGTIKLYQKSLFKSGLHNAGTYELSIGDELLIKGQNSPAFGFISVNEKPNITVSYRVVGQEALVTKPGGSNRIIDVNIVDRILNDKFLSLISLSIGALIGIVTLLTFILDFFMFRLTLKK